MESKPRTKRRPTKSFQEQPPKSDPIQNELEGVIKKQVFDAIGTVKDMSKFRAKRLWDYNWRVNIWCEYESETELSVLKRTRIAYSYFIRTDKEGNNLNSDPELGVKQ